MSAAERGIRAGLVVDQVAGWRAGAAAGSFFAVIYRPAETCVRGRAAAWPHPFERAARNRKNDAGAGPRESSRQAPSAHEEHHVEVDPHALTSSALGRSQQAVAKLFEQSIPELAMDGAAIVLLDEVETLAVDRHQLSLEANPIDVHRATAAALPAWTG